MAQSRRTVRKPRDVQQGPRFLVNLETYKSVVKNSAPSYSFRRQVTPPSARQEREYIARAAKYFKVQLRKPKVPVVAEVQEAEQKSQKVQRKWEK